MEGRFERIGHRWCPAGTAGSSPDAPVSGSWWPVQGGDEIAGELLRCDQLPFLKCRPRDIDVPKFIEMAG
jgi:hypothetical protein